MAHVFKPTYTKPIPADARIVTNRKGQRLARFKHNGTTIEAPLTKDGSRCRIETEEWYVRYKDLNGKWKAVKGYTDRRATESMAFKLQERVDQKLEGVNPYKEHHERPLSEHLDDWKANMLDQGKASRSQVEQVEYRARRIVEGCEFQRITDMTAEDVEAYLAKRRNDSEDPLSAQSSNHYLQAVKRFSKWLMKKGRTDRDRLSDAAMLKISDEKKTHKRRALTSEEFTRLVEAAAGGEVIEGIPGPDRAMLYILAGWTGYRRAELASLTLRSFDLDSETHSVSVQSGYTKNKKAATIPLHPVVVERVRTWLATKDDLSPDAPLLPLRTAGGWLRKTSKLMKRDLKAARQKWIEETKIPEEQARREASDFLVYQDEEGAFADFHANRHTFITNLGRAGVPLAVAQKLARHSDPKLTASVYTHLRVHDQAGAVASLPAPPDLTKTEEQQEGGAVLLATGTDLTPAGGEKDAKTSDSQAPMRLTYACQATHPATRGDAQQAPSLEVDAEDAKKQINPLARRGLARQSTAMHNLAQVRLARFERATYGLGNRCSIP